MNKNLLKKLSTFMKYAVFAACVIMTAHVICLLCGHNFFFAEWICGLSVMGFIMLYIASRILGYDFLFRAMLVYDFAVNQCIIFQRSFSIFGEYLTTARYIVAIWGIILIVSFLLNANNYQEDDSTDEI